MQKAELEAMTPSQKAQMKKAREARLKPFAGNAEESAFSIRDIVKNSNLDTETQKAVDDFVRDYITKNRKTGSDGAPNQSWKRKLRYYDLYHGVTKHLVDKGLDADDLMEQLYTQFDRGFDDFDRRLVRDIKEAGSVKDGIKEYGTENIRGREPRDLGMRETGRIVVPGVRRIRDPKAGNKLEYSALGERKANPVTKRSILRREAEKAKFDAEMDRFTRAREATAPASSPNEQLAQLDAQIASLRSQEKPAGFWGRMLGQKGTSKQKEIDELIRQRTSLQSELEKPNPRKLNKGGIVYANNGALVPYLSQGGDTVPAMLTPGEFVVNREASQQHMPLLHAINSGHFNRGGVVNYLANGGIVAPKYYANAGPVTGGSGGSSGVSNDISSSISAAVAQAMNEAVGQLGSTLQSGMETYSQMMQSNTETLNNFGQTFASASQTIASSASTWSETASQIPTSLTAEVTGRQVVDFTGLGREGDRIVSSAAQAGELAGSQTSQNTIARYDRAQFDGNLNTAANNRPMRT